jgi:hypothetical protein
MKAFTRYIIVSLIGYGYLTCTGVLFDFLNIKLSFSALLIYYIFYYSILDFALTLRFVFSAELINKRFLKYILYQLANIYVVSFAANYIIEQGDLAAFSLVLASVMLFPFRFLIMKYIIFS